MCTPADFCNTFDYSDDFFTIDNTAPTVTDDYVDDGIWVGSSQTVILDPQDITSGIKEVKYCEGTECDPSIGTVLSSPYNIEYTTTQNVIVKYQAWDNADNPSAIGQYNVKIDKDAPVTTDDSDTDWHAGDKVITLSPSDGTGSGVAHTYYCVYNSGEAACTPTTEGTSVSVTCSLGSVCEQIVKYYSVDNVGNAESEKESNVVNIDKEVPEVSGIAVDPDYTSTFTSGAYEISATIDDDSGSGVVSCQYTVDGTNYYAADWDSGTCSKSLISSDGTALTINFKGTDSVGNEGTGTSISRTVDDLVPSTTDDSDTDWHAGDKVITLSPSDGTGSGVAHTYYCVYNSGEAACTPTTEGTSVSVDCPADSVCEKIVRYYSVDNVDNIEATKESNAVKIDKQSPTVTVTGEPSNWLVTQSGVTASADCDDGVGSGCNGGTLVYKTYDADPGICSDTYADYTDSATITGHKWVCAAQKDDMENEGFSSPVEFKVASTIQDAIDSAFDGDTINVAAGTYTEDLTIDKSLTLQGAGASSVTVNGVHTITSSDVVIKGFTLNPNGGIGIKIDSSSSTISNIGIENNVFDLTTGQPIGILLGGYTSPNKVSNVDMNYNTFNGPTTKICNPWKIGGYFGNPVGCEVEGVDFEHNTINRCSIPINLHDQDIKDVLINDNTFRNTDGVVYVWEDALESPTGILSQFVFTNNDIDSTNSYGVGIDTASPPVFSDLNFGTGNAINYNDFVGIPGAYGFEAVSILSSLTTYELDAKKNWWGDNSGPYHATRNPDGQGDEVSDNVDFAPWLDESDQQYADIFIDADEDGQYDDGEEAFYSIQDAVDAASDGDTIVVGAGTYVEDLTIDETKTNLELVGEDKTTTTIKGIANVHKDDWPLGVPNIEILADNVVIHGFTIEGPNYVADYYASGIILDGQNIEIYDNNFVTTQADTIDELAHAITTYSKTVIPSADVSGLNIHDNTFTGSGTYGCEAIYINPHTGTGTITIDNNQFSGSIYIGITAESGNANVTGNTINSAVNGLYGIRFMDTSYAATYDDIEISGNTIQNTQRGIRVGNGGAGDSVFIASILSNTLTNNDIGIWGRLGNELTVTGNSISGNTVGIQNDGATTVDAENNWWGDPTGPDHSSNPRGLGDDVSDNVDFYPWAYNTDMDVDTTDPVTTIDSPAASSWHKEDFQVDISDSDTGGSELYYCEYRVLSDESETVAWTDKTCSSSVTLTVGSGKNCDVEGEDECQIEVKATDKGGNTGTVQSRTFSIDWTPPTTTDSGTDTNWHDSNVIVTLTCDDGIGIGCDQTYYCIDQAGTCDPTTPGTSPVTSVVVSAEGENYVRFYSVDQLGNTETEKNATNTVKIDKSSPQITDVTGDVSIQVGEVKEISATITDVDSGIASAIIHYTPIGGTETPTPMTNIGGDTWKGTIPAQAESGEVPYYIVAEDNVGNSETSNTYTLTVYDFVLSLKDGWNQISVPKEPDTESFNRILASGEVFEYDAESQAWITEESLSSIEPGVGYFIDSDSEQDVGINYKPGAADPNAPSPVVDLVSGWNLIGHMCTSSSNISHVFNTEIAKDRLSQMLWYDTGAGGYDYYVPIYREDFDTMEAGKGYWILLVMPTGEGSIPYTNTCSV